MAPSTLAQIDDEIKAIVQNLFNLIVQSYNYQGPSTAEALVNEIKTLLTNLHTLTRSAPSLPVSLPPEVIQYVEEGRNPDIYTREFVELTYRNNQHLKGRAEAFADFRDVLAHEIAAALPDLRQEVVRVLDSTGAPPLKEGE